MLPCWKIICFHRRHRGSERRDLLQIANLVFLNHTLQLHDIGLTFFMVQFDLFMWCHPCKSTLSSPSYVCVVGDSCLLYSSLLNSSGNVAHTDSIIHSRIGLILCNVKLNQIDNFISVLCSAES